MIQTQVGYLYRPKFMEASLVHVEILVTGILMILISIPQTMAKGLWPIPTNGSCPSVCGWGQTQTLLANVLAHLEVAGKSLIDILYIYTYMSYDHNITWNITLVWFVCVQMIGVYDWLTASISSLRLEGFNHHVPFETVQCSSTWPSSKKTGDLPAKIHWHLASPDPSLSYLHHGKPSQFPMAPLSDSQANPTEMGPLLSVK